MIAIKIPQNEEIFGGGKNGGRNRVSSALRWRGVNKRGVHIKKREQRGVAKRGI